ncbi:adenosine deaminase [Cordyceps javanica]|uniref:Adenosine deaminase n=1 Tax=Cordyceps javanica TaxID=43265 RepID=A0A545UQW3_9HYPO|nr:adenosine deaminase [Cordyceps javanica]
MDYVALPKIELHAHLTGSISRRTLHDIWLRKVEACQTDLQDPLEVMPEGKHDYNIQTFFPLFSKYIYNLLVDEASIREATTAVLQGFHDDGVVYLELRTTPRATAHLSAEAYVRTVLAAVADFGGAHPRMRTRLILSVDRRHDAATAEAVVALATALRPPVVGRARAAGLGITVHFAEARASGSRAELDVLLGWRPRRLGHVIWEDDEARREIAARGLCLELCLSCNVRAGMVEGGFAGHHLGYWRTVKGPKISLATDDVGVFGSPLSNEYELAALHFNLDRQDICSLAREAIDSIFGSEEDKEWLRSIMWTS